MKKIKFIKITCLIFIVCITFSLASCSYASDFLNKTISVISENIKLKLSQENVFNKEAEEEDLINKREEILKGISPRADKELFLEYFSELGLGKLEERGVLPSDIIKGDNTFISFGKDRIIIYGNLLKDAEIEILVFDTEKNKEINLNEIKIWRLNAGHFALSEPVAFTSGNYEYTVNIYNKTAGVFPFKVSP